MQIFLKHHNVNVGISNYGTQLGIKGTVSYRSLNKRCSKLLEVFRALIEIEIKRYIIISI